MDFYEIFDYLIIKNYEILVIVRNLVIDLQTGSIELINLINLEELWINFNFDKK